MRFSIVTPSFNQSRYLESCLRSVLAQGVKDLEYLVLDGGSTDDSVEIIRRHSDRLTFWRSHPDGGQMDAVEEGFLRSTGDIMGWLNSDDMLAPWALQTVEKIFSLFPQVEWLTARYPMVMDERGVVVRIRRSEGFNSQAFFRGRNLPLNPRFYTHFIQQESTFWRRSLWQKAGGLVDTTLRMTGDFELWSRFFRHAELYAANIPLGIFRQQAESFTAKEMDIYLDSCRQILRRQNVRPPSMAECWLRRLLRLLPPRLNRFTGFAYPAPIISHTGRGGHWITATEWFI